MACAVETAETVRINTPTRHARQVRQPETPVRRLENERTGFVPNGGRGNFETLKLTSPIDLIGVLKNEYRVSSTGYQ